MLRTAAGQRARPVPGLRAPRTGPRQLHATPTGKDLPVALSDSKHVPGTADRYRFPTFTSDRAPGLEAAEPARVLARTSEVGRFRSGQDL